MIKIHQLKNFLKQEGINIRGFAKEAGIDYGHLKKVVNGDRPLIEKTISKLVPVMVKYGFKFEGE